LAILTPRDIGVNDQPSQTAAKNISKAMTGDAALAATASSFRPRESSCGGQTCTDGLAGHSAADAGHAEAAHLSACQAHRPVCPSQLKCLTYWSHQVDTCATKQSDC